MIQTRIPGIDAGEIELNIEEELQKLFLEKIPEDTGEFWFPEEETVFRKELYGLSYYLKQLRDPVYRKNAFRKILTSREYRKTIWFLLKRAFVNKVRLLFRGLRP